MKIKSLLAGLILTSAVASASITISGTSILSADLNNLGTGVYIASSTNAFDIDLFDFSGSLDSGLSFAAGSTFNGYTVLGSASINPAGAQSALVSGVTYNLGGNVATGNAIGVLAFASSTSETIAGDSFSIFTGGWVVPADGANLGLTGSPLPSFLGASGTGSVAVPEPSAYALLGGLFALTCVMLRRRA